MSTLATGVSGAATGSHRHATARRAEAGTAADFHETVASAGHKARDGAKTPETHTARTTDAAKKTGDGRIDVQPPKETAATNEAAQNEGAAEPVERDQRRRRRTDDDLAGTSTGLPVAQVAVSTTRSRSGDVTVTTNDADPDLKGSGEFAAKELATATPASPRAPASASGVDPAPPVATAHARAGTTSLAAIAATAPDSVSSVSDMRPSRAGDTSITEIISLLSTSDQAPEPETETASPAAIADSDAPAPPGFVPAPARAASFQAELTAAAANYSVTSVRHALSPQGRQSDARTTTQTGERTLANAVRIATTVEPSPIVVSTDLPNDGVAAERSGVSFPRDTEISVDEPVAKLEAGNTGKATGPASTGRRTAAGPPEDVASSESTTETRVETDVRATRDTSGTARTSSTDTLASPLAAPVSSPAASSLLAAIAAEPNWRPATVAATTQLGRLQAARAATDLHIQLHPAELGMVTASLRLSGTQLSVEITPESSEAHARLKADSDTILKALRALGFEVDQVSITQPVIAANSAPRSDPTAPAAMVATREQDMSGTSSSGGGGRSGSQQSGRNDNEAGPISHQSTPGTADRARGGVYI